MENISCDVMTRERILHRHLCTLPLDKDSDPAVLGLLAITEGIPREFVFCGDLSECLGSSPCLGWYLQETFEICGCRSGLVDKYGSYSVRGRAGE